jgi:D-alanyl-lipoteichoic acid acyltransferase DltB (MBOAT superfamily)
MKKCISTNYSMVDFWKNWHTSYNHWLVRYMYIPFGGKSNRFKLTIIIFTFVAFWHDLTGRVFIWGWLISIFIIPEILAIKIFSKQRFKDYFGRYHVYLGVCGGSANMLIMSCMNLIGYSVGLEGFLEMIKKLGSFKGLVCVFYLFVSFALQTSFMFALEEYLHHNHIKNDAKTKAFT